METFHSFSGDISNCVFCTHFDIDYLYYVMDTTKCNVCIHDIGLKALAIVLRTIAIAIGVKKSIEYCNMQ